jgi:hypothetical protein
MYQTVSEITKNILTRRSGRLSSALSSLALLSPMRALSASALVATTMLALAGQSAHGEEAQADDIASSGAALSERVATAQSLGIPDVDKLCLPPDSKSIPNSADAMTRTSAVWEGVYFAHLKDIVDLTTPGPNGYNTEEWRYILVLRAGGVAQFTAQIFYNYYPGSGKQNSLRYFSDVWGPRQTATWTDRGGQLWITGSVAEGLQDTGNQALNCQRHIPRATVTFILRWLGSDYKSLQLTGVINNRPFPSQEGNTWTFYKIAD